MTIKGAAGLLLISHALAFLCNADTNFIGIGTRLLPPTTLHFADGSALPLNPGGQGGQATESPETFTSFFGMDRVPGGFLPQTVADTMGAVGTNHVVSLSNAGITFHTRSGTILGGSNLAQLFGVSGVIDYNQIADPRIVYDPYAHRWIASAVSERSFQHTYSNSVVLLAVSSTANPSNNWHTQLVFTDPTGALGPDQPTLGFNKQWIVVQVNMTKTSVVQRSHI